MKQVKEEKAVKGHRGVGNLVKLGGDRARMDFEDGKVFELSISQETIPDIVLKVYQKMPDNAKLPLEATMDETGKKIMFAKPLVGTFDFKFIKFFAAEGEIPSIKTNVGAGGKPYRSFSAVLEVQKKTNGKTDDWKGVRYNVMFFDSFAKDVDGNLAVSGSNDSAEFLKGFLEAVGVWNIEIPFSENPLPKIESLALEQGRIFSADVRKVVSKKGTFANVTQFNNYDMEFGEYEAPQAPNGDVHPALQ